MKFRCERDVLVEALATAGRAVSGRGTLPGLSGVRAQLVGDALRLTGSDLDLTITIGVMVSGERDGVAIIPARLASDIVRSLSPGAVSVAADGDELLISAGRSQFSIRLIAGDEFPQIEPVGGDPVTLKSAQLAEALKQVVPAASNDDSRPRSPVCSSPPRTAVSGSWPPTPIASRCVMCRACRCSPRARAS